MTTTPLRTIMPSQVAALARDAVDEATLQIAQGIVADVKARGMTALREHAERLGDRAPGEPLILERSELLRARDAISAADREVLERTADRIQRFAEAQRASVREFDVPVPGGRAGQSIAPMTIAGCYAPGGRFPLPSSVLMTAVTARVAGVQTVIVSSPKPALHTLAAAAIADADLMVTAGGAQAIAALAYGVEGISSCDVVVGPGNRYVTAAKQLVSGHVAIDMLAGPSELTVVADEDADPAVVAMDLLAQAEHDVDAVPVLVALHASVVEAVNAELVKALESLPTRDTARRALQNGFAVVARDLDEAVTLCDRLAPEHLSLHVRNATSLQPRLAHYGALFVGGLSAEVFGDYGAGPNHTLPTGGTARFSGGLSVFHFLRVRTWLRLDDCVSAQSLVEDAVRLGQIEGLEAHACSAALRREDATSEGLSPFC